MTTHRPFHTRAAAAQAAREFIWGDVPFAKREFVSPRTHPELAVYDDRGLPVLAVSAQVNKDHVVFEFDHYGRVILQTVLARSN